MTAVGFYEKLGYASVGREFMEVGLPHIRMEKHIQAGQAAGNMLQAPTSLFQGI